MSKIIFLYRFLVNHSGCLSGSHQHYHHDHTNFLAWLIYNSILGTRMIYKGDSCQIVRNDITNQQQHALFKRILEKRKIKAFRVKYKGSCKLFKDLKRYRTAWPWPWIKLGHMQSHLLHIVKATGDKIDVTIQGRNVRIKIKRKGQAVPLMNISYFKPETVFRTLNQFLTLAGNRALDKYFRTPKTKFMKENLIFIVGNGPSEALSYPLVQTCLIRLREQFGNFFLNIIANTIPFIESILKKICNSADIIQNIWRW